MRKSTVIFLTYTNNYFFEGFGLTNFNKQLFQINLFLNFVLVAKLAQLCPLWTEEDSQAWIIPYDWCTVLFWLEFNDIDWCNVLFWLEFNDMCQDTNMKSMHCNLKIFAGMHVKAFEEDLCSVLMLLFTVLI